MKNALIDFSLLGRFYRYNVRVFCLCLIHGIESSNFVLDGESGVASYMGVSMALGILIGIGCILFVILKGGPPRDK